jgi:Glycosyltransferase like family 2
VIVRRLGRALDWRFAAVLERLAALSARLDHLQGSVDELSERITSVGATLEILAEQGKVLPHLAAEAELTHEVLEQRLQPTLRVLVDEEAENRRRLHELRASPSYEGAYIEPDPLVSVVVASTGRELLFERTLPSLLAQSHANLEVVVVGDAVPSEVGERLSFLNDPRVRYSNLTQRITAHPDPRRHWLVGSTMARNEGARLARGLWLVHFDDDDLLRPEAISSLLELARNQRVEVAYGAIRERHPDGAETTLSGFPPRLGTFSWAGALMHGGLRFFERELLAAHLEIPGDMYALERMLRAGVRFAMLDATVLDYFPSTLWEPPGPEDI